MRPREGAKPVDLTVLRKALEDRRAWSGLAKVVLRDGESSHFEIETDEDGNPVDVLVEIDIMPEEIPVTARLGCFGSTSPGSGIYSIPKPGTEVAWLAPHGELEADIFIVGCLASNSVPAVLDEDTLVILGAKNVVIASTDSGSRVKLGAPDGSSSLQPAVVGDDLETRLQTIESKLKTHTHPYSGGSGPAGSVNFITGAVTGISGVTANGGASADVGTPPTIKSATTEVAK